MPFRNVIYFFVATIVPFVGYLVHTYFFRGWLIDDAGITFAYARNWIHGFGLVAQPGAVPVEGFSNPLWTLLISPIFIADPVDPTFAVKLVSAGLVALTYLLIAAIHWRLFTDARDAAWATLLSLGLLSTSTSFAIWTSSGLENALYAMLVAAYGWAILASLGGGKEIPRYGYVVGLAAAGLALTRPDGATFLFIFPFAQLWSRLFQRSTRSDSALMIRVFMTSFLPIFAYEVIRLVYFKDLVPNTFRAKIGPSSSILIFLQWFVDFWLSQSRQSLVLQVFVLVTLTIALVWQGARIWTKIESLVLRRIQKRLQASNNRFDDISKTSNASQIGLLIPVWACALVTYIVMPHDWMPHYRFATPLIVATTILIGALCTQMTRRWGANAQRQRLLRVIGTMGILLLSVLGHASGTRGFVLYPTVPFRQTAKNVGIRFNVFAERLGLEQASLLSPDLGGTLYFSQLRTIDLAGLCDKEIARLYATRQPELLARHIIDSKPTFIDLHGSYFIEKSGLFDHPQFRAKYATITETTAPLPTKPETIRVIRGEYVLKSAIPASQKLEALKSAIDSGEFDLPPPERWIAFPVRKSPHDNPSNSN